MPKYRVKSKVFEAEQFIEWNKPWPAGVYRSCVDGTYRLPCEKDAPTEDPDYPLRSGDYIITNGGRRYPVARRYFEETYEPVEGKR